MEWDLFSQSHNEADHDERQESEAEKREKLLLQLHSFTLDTVEARVAYVLNRHPETRDSDIALQIRYWETFNRDDVADGIIRLEDLYHLPRYGSLVRARAKVQNAYKLFQAFTEVQQRRGVLSEEEKQKAVASKVNHPSILVYADESGKNERFLVVGSLWVISPGFTDTVREIREWKSENLEKRELHFKKVGRATVEIYVDLIDRFIKSNPAFGFKYISSERTGIHEREAFSELFYYILRRGLEHEHNTGRAKLPRTLEFCKDAESKGYDDLVLAETKRRLELDNKAVFDGQLTLEDFYPLDSKLSPGIELADLFTGCVNRVVNPPEAEPNYKDEFARYFLESVGLSLEGDEQVLGDRAVRLSL